MNPMLKRVTGFSVIAGLVALLALNLVWIARNGQLLGGTRAGQAAPELPLPLLDGGEARWRGGITVLSFWATWCAPCVHELPDLQRLADERKDVKFFAVNVEGRENLELVRAFRDRMKLRIPIAFDDGAASQAYRVDTIPRTVIIGSDGRIAAALDGAHPLDELRGALEKAR
jgi:thiol-disulfide isomerase/thioredoxin